MSDPALDEQIARRLFGESDFGSQPHHVWKMNPDGSRYSVDVDPHSGPWCERCETSFCEHGCADDARDMKGPCVKEPHGYSGSDGWFFRVVEAMRARGFGVMIAKPIGFDWQVEFGGEVRSKQSDPKLMLAACRSALRALDLVEAKK